MVVTLTLNPSLDYVLDLPSFTLGKVNRAGQANLLPGGKGLNVSILLERLGISSRALGFAAGFTGEQLRKSLRTLCIDEKLLMLPEGLTRLNVKLRAEQETDVNAPGPIIPSWGVVWLLEQLDELTADDILVLAGSIPPGLPSYFYGDILQRLQGRGVRCVVDAQGTALQTALPFQPFLIKPNRTELEELAGVPLSSDADLQEAALSLQKQGAQNVLVSLGGDGAFLLDERGGLHAACAPTGTVRGAVGAGDSMVAGFLAGFLSRGEYAYAFQMGVAAGSATAFSDWLAEKETIFRLMDSVKPTSSPGRRE